MKVNIYFLLLLVISSCTTAKQRSTDVSKKTLTQREMDLSSAIEYIKFDNKDCAGNCTFRVSGLFEYFDNCLMVWDSSYFKSLGLDLNHSSTYNQKNFHIDDFGVIFFTNHRDSLDYYFSPLIYDERNNSLQGQVRNKENIRISYGINILRNKFYISYFEPYPDNCWW